jgi:signal transduction histidine kinase/ActR/RegA family two-component response regulator
MITWIAGIVAAIVAVTLPLGYLSVAYRSLAMELGTEAKFRSEMITQFINDRPLAWKHSEHHLDELLTRNPPLRKQQWNRLVDRENHEVMAAGQRPSPPTLTISTDVYDAGKAAGRLEVHYSIRSLVEITLVVAVFGLMLGGGVFVALRVLPLRALGRATQALQEEVKQHAKARAAAEAANRGKSQFLAAASHDLRQPLHALGLFAASLAEKERDPEVRAVVDNISASVEALEALFTELLDISKLDAGVIQPNLTNFAVKPIFDRLRVDYDPEARQKGVRLSVRPTAARVYSDPTLLERILRNLIANAIRYTDKGSVVVGCRSRGDGYSLEVWDSGVGIPEDKLGKIFDEFYQASNPERDRRKGLGLGLAIVKRIEQLLGYRLEVSSQVGRGSVFRFRVPRGSTERLGPEDAAWRRQSADQLRAKCVLVVDDEFAVREGMKALLSGWGCDVIAAESLSDALVGIAEHARKPEAIIADYRLREGATGVEIIQSLHAEFGSDIPAILVTGDISADSMIDVRESGYAQLHKPVPAATLRAALNAMFEKA